MTFIFFAAIFKGGDEEVIPLIIKQAIEEAKKKFPEKAKALDEIEIKGKPLASTLEVDPLTILIIVVILRPIEAVPQFILN